jgi:DNA replication and repair protein RecF
VKLRRLALTGFRNLHEQALEPGEHATVFFGDNGQGKTNLLEACYFLTTFRSFRAGKLDEIAAWGRERASASASADLVAGGLSRRLEVHLEAGRKTILLDGKPTRRDAAVLANVAAVLFVPEDLLLPKAAPAARRRFLDRAVFSTDRTFARHATLYDRALRARNVLLRQGSLNPTLIDSYDEELARSGAVIVMRRNELVAALAPRVTALFSAMGAETEATIRYRRRPAAHARASDAGADSDTAAGMLAGLRGERQTDLRRGFTGFGPHTDDLEFDLGGHPAAEHGSQGQLRSLVLALKLAELTHLDHTKGEPPLLLLDDVASELDQRRRRMLFETIAGLTAQTIITVTDPELLPALPGRVDFELRAGKIRAA